MWAHKKFWWWAVDLNFFKKRILKRLLDVDLLKTIFLRCSFDDDFLLKYVSWGLLDL